MKPFYKLFAMLVALLFVAPAHLLAKVTLPSVITDNMVLQQKTKAGLWGKAAAGINVLITTSWDSEKYSVNTNNAGNWNVKLSTPAFGGPFTITINDGDETVLRNILIGEVWVCSGQSNMEMPLAGWGFINNYEQEVASANFAKIRLLQLQHVTSNALVNDAAVTSNGWTVCSPDNVKSFSSVAYFFAREIFNTTGIPVGLIHTSWGGTIAEAWMSSITLKTTSDFAEATRKIEQEAGSQNVNDYNKKVQDWQQMFVTRDNGYANGRAIWADAINTGDWKTMQVPTLWESSVLPEFDGVVWLKKKIMVAANMVTQGLQVSFGPIDDNDITWINGTKVGQTEGYAVERTYNIPAGLIKEGENEITIRVFDGAGGGGFYGDADKIALTSTDGNRVSLTGAWQYKVGVDMKNMPASPVQASGPNRPTVLFNAMIHPLLNYTIKGAIWYQGESNAGRAYQYRWLFPILITDWRKNWQQGDFPFYFVQLANFMKPYEGPEQSAWAELREAQQKTLSLSNTGMAVTIDIGEAKDIHPKNKQEVGRRLALIALSKTYGKAIEYSGPVYLSKVVNGNTIRLNFSHEAGGLKAAEGVALNGFEVAGADKKFYIADASIISNVVVVVSSKQVLQPLQVRYSWANNPNGNLYNGKGLPASPFRTDDFTGVTEGKK